MGQSDIIETATRNGFESSLAHILAKLNRIELILQTSIKRNDGQRSSNGKYADHPLPSDMEPIFSTLLDRPTDNTDIDRFERSLRELEYDISRSEAESRREGTEFPLCELQKLFGLSTLEVDILLLCLLPEIDSRCESYYAYLQDDVTKKTPTVDIILKLLCTNLEDKTTNKNVFYPDAPLIKNGLINLYSEPGRNDTPLSRKSIRIDDRIVDYLTGQNHLDSRLEPFAILRQPEIPLGELVLPGDFKERLGRINEREAGAAPVYYFHGPDGTGKRTAAEGICYEKGISLLDINVRHMLATDLPVEQALRLVFREGKLQKAAVYLNDSDLLLNRNSSESYNAGSNVLLTELDKYPNPCFLSSMDAPEATFSPCSKLSVAVEFILPDYQDRKQLWQQQSQNGVRVADDADFSDLANKFRLTPGQIAEAFIKARNMALWRDPGDSVITGQDLYLACRQQSRQKLDTLTSQISSKYDWDDIILPRDQKEQLVEICNQVKYSNVVYNDWGFGQKHVRGKGLNILFSGPSGTGKTMAAEIMANELGIDLYRIDISTVVSKYIGETEKNLDRIFREGTTANAIIFFDEADSLFGKRSEVKDAHDRYANIEIAYLLQKMEEYDGVIILATNFRKNLDDAFTRRMHFAVEFPMPEEADRLKIWKNIFPEKTPLGQNLDLSFLARQFSVTGGNIRNIALAAAFLAAQDGGMVTMGNIIRATRREYQKMGKLCTENDFADYFGLVREQGNMSPPKDKQGTDAAK